MARIIAYCGLVCSECPAYIATQNDDQALRAKTAEEWSRQYGLVMKPEDINCDGCIAEGGRQISYCRECPIRTCGVAKEVENCGFCADYPCGKLEEFFANVAAARETLDGIARGRKGR